MLRYANEPEAIKRYLSTQFLSILMESRIVDHVVVFHDVDWLSNGRASRSRAISAKDALIVSTTKREFYRVSLDSDSDEP